MEPQDGDLTVLWDGVLFPFRDFRSIDIPRNIAGVYTVWEGDRFIYVGIGGTKIRYREPTDESDPSKPVKGLWGRLEQHFSGDRSSDRFCLLIFDRFVLPGLTAADIGAAAAGQLSLNERTRVWIHDHFAFRYLQVADGPSAANVETAIKRGALPVGRPLLNGQ
jgi:hypothetical protein